MWLRLIPGVLFTAMARGQLASLLRMPAILAAQGLHPRLAALAVAVALIAGELLVGAWFAERPRSWPTMQVAVRTAVAAAWTAPAVGAFARGAAVPNCGCFGRYLPQRLSWITLIEEVLLLVYGAVPARVVRRARLTSPAWPRPAPATGSQAETMRHRGQRPASSRR